MELSGHETLRTQIQKRAVPQLPQTLLGRREKMPALWTLGMIGYEIDFAFCERPGFPPKSMLTCFRKTGDEVIELLDYVGREHLFHIQLTNIGEPHDK